MSSWASLTPEPPPGIQEGVMAPDFTERIRGEPWKAISVQLRLLHINIFWAPAACQIDRETTETVTDFIFLGSKITADDDYIREIKKRLLAPWKKSYDQPRQHIKKQRHYFADKGPSSQSYGFSRSHVWM